MKRFVRREYENTALVAVRQERVIVLFWTRRGRKSTTLGSIAFDEMSREAGRTVISASASLLLGTELVNMTVSATEQAFLVTNEAAALHAVFEDQAAQNGFSFQVANAETGKIYPNISREDLADLYSSKKLEFRLYHSKDNYSRQIVIAPNPATARGWRGTVFRDEAGFTQPGLERELRDAVDPIFRDVPDLKMIYASNLPRDDRHPFFEMTMPTPGTKFEVNPAGNFYRGQDGILVHRVTLQDAYAAGHMLYDNKGQPMTYEAFAALSANKSQMPYNYDLIHQMGGSGAIDLLAMLTAQTRGALKCGFVFVENELDFLHALNLLRTLLGDGPVGIGFDTASTEGEKSNPGCVVVTELVGIERIQRLVVCWKERRELVQKHRVREIILTIQARPHGGAGKKLNIDGSNERLFAQGLAEELAPLIPCEVIVNSTRIHPPGYKEATNFKTFLGDLYSAAFNENKYSSPSDEYFKKDHRQPVKTGGTYQCAVASDGGHGDTFDGGKLAEYALMGPGDSFILEAFDNPGHVAAANRERRDRSCIG